MKKIILGFLFFLILFISYAYFQFKRYSNSPKTGYDFSNPVDPPEIDSEWVSESLSRMIQFPTISGTNEEHDYFDQQLEFLRERFPLLHDSFTFEVVNNMAYLYRWNPKTITDPEILKHPILILAHCDVVPIEEEELWTHPPFSGKIEDGVIWGRGALDDKNFLISVFSALEMLLKEDYVPEYPIYLAIGLDEETGGLEGAQKVAEQLQEEGIRPIIALDEGGLIGRNMMKELGISKDIAFIGLAEKVGAIMEVTVTVSDVAHASMPGTEVKAMAITYISELVTRAIKNPPPTHSTSSLFQLFLHSLAPNLSPLPRLFISLAHNFGFLMDFVFTKEKKQAAMIRSAVSPIYIHSGEDNQNCSVFSGTGVARFVIYKHPEDDMEGLEEYYKKLFNADTDNRVKIEIFSLPPHEISEYYSQQFEILESTVSSVFENTVSIPFLYIAGSDLRYYHKITKYAYNFMPFVYDELSGDFGLLHGVDERVSVEGMVKATQFFYSFIKNINLGEY